MKKIILAILLVICAAMLLGCTPEETPETPALYWNADRGMERTAEADGSYQVMFILDGQQVTLRVPDAEMMQYIDVQDALGLTVDSSNTITAVTHIMDMPQYYLTLDYPVQSLGGTTVKLNSMSSFNGREVVVKYDDATKILDVSQSAANKGTPTELQKGDGVTVIADQDGSIPYIFVSQRDGILTTQMRYCPVCDKEVEFSNWFSSVSMPFIPGHYYLENDITIASSANVGAGEITLDLNGKTATMAREGQRFFILSDGAILNLVDTVGSGKAVVAGSGSGQFDTGMFVYMGGFQCQFNMYSGTIDATNCICRCGCIVDNYDGVFNMYGGTFLGGTAWGVGGGTILVQNVVNIYDGELIGGKCAKMEYASVNPHGGGSIRHNGVTSSLNIYGGTIRGGSSDFKGGCIYINGPLNLYGGTITGGSAEQAGGGIYVGMTGSINLAGDVTVTDNEDGNIYLSEGGEITVAEEGLGEIKIGIEMAEPGTFISGAVPKDKVSGFTADDGTIVQNPDGSLSIK